MKPVVSARRPKSVTRRLPSIPEGNLTPSPQPHGAEDGVETQTALVHTGRRSGLACLVLQLGRYEAATLELLEARRLLNASRRERRNRVRKTTVTRESRAARAYEAAREELGRQKRMAGLPYYERIENLVEIANALLHAGEHLAPGDETTCAAIRERVELTIESLDLANRDTVLPVAGTWRVSGVRTGTR